MTQRALPIVDRALLRRCVHCGLCLPTCPTFTLLGDERDSPRGRLFQMKAALDGAISLDDPLLNRHLSRCLDCRACETACPAGIQYGRILEGVRASMPVSPRARALRRVVLGTVFTSPKLLDLAGWGLRRYQRSGARRLARRLGLFNLLPGDLGEMEALLPAAPRPVHLHVHSIPTHAPIARVGLVTGCVMKQFFGQVHQATIKVLVANNCEVVIPPRQGCCGALHSHAGEREQAQQLARAMIDAFPPNLDAVLINAAGCGSALKEYGHLLADDPEYAERASDFAARVYDIHEWLAKIAASAGEHALARRVTYQDACHLRHAQRIQQQPRRLLQSIPELNLVEMAGSQDCCGSAGIYNITQPELAAQLLARKIDSIEATGAEIVAVGNPGCAIQIAAGLRARGLRLRVAHPIELLAESYTDVPPVATVY